MRTAQQGCGAALFEQARLHSRKRLSDLGSNALLSRRFATAFDELLQHPEALGIACPRKSGDHVLRRGAVGVFRTLPAERDTVSQLPVLGCCERATVPC